MSRDYSPEGLYKERVALRAAIQKLKDERDAAVAAEREACAKVAEGLVDRVRHGDCAGRERAAYQDIAAAIRARGDKPSTLAEAVDKGRKDWERAVEK